jgi:hypothetical protein
MVFYLSRKMSRRKPRVSAFSRRACRSAACDLHPTPFQKLSPKEGKDPHTQGPGTLSDPAAPFFISDVRQHSQSSSAWVLLLLGVFCHKKIPQAG